MPTRREDIDAKQALLGRIAGELGCEAVVLFVPVHVAWFTGGLNVRGLIADGERPGIYTNGRQRWLLSSNIDSQRFFDEDLDGLGFQIKEWHWANGRGPLLSELVGGKKVAADRPFQNMPLVNEKLRPELGPLFQSDRERYRALGKILAHALEATARTFNEGDTEEEMAGQLAHRLYHKGADATALSVVGGSRGLKYRRSGFTSARVEQICTLQATASKGGLHATAARTVSLGPPPSEYRTDFDMCCKVGAIYRSQCVPGGTVAGMIDAAHTLLKGTAYEHDWRLYQPGYVSGWFHADELRKAGTDEPFVLNQALTLQVRLGSAAIVGTFLVNPEGHEAITSPTGWPFKRIGANNAMHDIPDILVREA